MPRVMIAEAPVGPDQSGNAARRRLAPRKEQEEAQAGVRVLVVEDNVDGRKTLCRLLQLLGHNVESAADGIEGVDKALAFRPRAAIIDIGLPRMDGYEVARHLRSAFGSEILLIACTAYQQPEDRQRAREAGFDAHLGKPIDLETLGELLRN